MPVFTTSLPGGDQTIARRAGCQVEVLAVNAGVAPSRRFVVTTTPRGVLRPERRLKAPAVSQSDQTVTLVELIIYENKKMDDAETAKRIESCRQWEVGAIANNEPAYLLTVTIVLFACGTIRSSHSIVAKSRNLPREFVGALCAWLGGSFGRQSQRLKPVSRSERQERMFTPEPI